jgi:ClpP class serine protease
VIEGDSAMDEERRSWRRGLWRLLKTLGWLILLVLLVQQVWWAPFRADVARTRVIDRFQQDRKSRVIAMIHRQDTQSIFGVPVSQSITIEDSEAVLRAIRLTSPEQPLDLILHTPGGLVLAAEQIAKALVEHKGKVTVFVPHYAMSGGTLLALTADEVVMDSNAVLGPVDPQIGEFPAASILRLLELKRPAQISDEMLVLADVAAKARLQVAAFVAEILLKHHPKDKAAALAIALTEGRWTHDFPITVQAARQLGIPVSVNMPPIIYELMDLYPQGRAGRPSVLYVPVRRERGLPRESGDSPPPRAPEGR